MAKVLRLSPAVAEEALAHLRSADPIMRRLIEGVGPFDLKPRRNRFQTLVRAIVSQQISSAAARSILRRLETAVEPAGLTPDAIARLSPKRMKAVGLSKQKQVYLKDLARHVREGLLQLDRMGRMHDEEVIAELVAVKGIGRWTAQMFLIFTLGRTDVFPHDDLGVRTAIKKA
jgi:DNA-3-methyladenine glycosylase II